MKPLLIILFLCFVCNVFGQDENNLLSLQLKGNVKTFSENKYEAEDKFGEIVKVNKITLREYGQYKNRTTYFDQNGRIITIISTEGAESIDKNNLKKEAFKYSNEGNIIEEFEYCNYYYDYNSKIIYSYNESNRLTEKSLYSPYSKDDEESLTEDNLFFPPESKSQKWIYKYDKNGNNIEITRCYVNLNIPEMDTIISKVIFKYDINNKKIERKEYANDRHSDFGGKLAYRDEFLYNEDGILAKEINYLYQDNKINRTTISEYNLQGELLKRSYGNSEEIYNYDKNNILTEKKYYKSSSLINNYKYKYDSNGNKIEEIGFNSSGEKIAKKWTYEFDSNGNWIKKIEYENDLFPTYLWEREFVYYE